MTEEQRPKRRMGFAVIDPDLQRRIASLGGKAAHAVGAGREWTHEEAAAAGRKGGKAAHERGTARQWTSEEARAAGRKGGEAHARAVRAKAEAEVPS